MKSGQEEKTAGGRSKKKKERNLRRCLSNFFTSFSKVLVEEPVTLNLNMEEWRPVILFSNDSCSVCINCIPGRVYNKKK